MYEYEKELEKYGVITDFTEDFTENDLRDALRQGACWTLYDGYEFIGKHGDVIAIIVGDEDGARVEWYEMLHDDEFHIVWTKSMYQFLTEALPDEDLAEIAMNLYADAARKELEDDGEEYDDDDILELAKNMLLHDAKHNLTSWDALEAGGLYVELAYVYHDIDTHVILPPSRARKEFGDDKTAAVSYMHQMKQYVRDVCEGNVWSAMLLTQCDKCNAWSIYDSIGGLVGEKYARNFAAQLLISYITQKGE